MFTPNKIKLTDENISYFSNINHLAKDIKKFFVFLANRERTIFEQLKNIKHNQLLHYISKSYGFNSYKDFNINKTSTDFLNLEKLKYEVSQGIKKTTGIKDELIEEVFDLFFLDVLSPRKDTLKSSVMKKIKNRLQKLKDFEKLDIYSDSKRRNKKEKLLVESFKIYISEEEYENIVYLIYGFMNNFEAYEKVISKKYSYVWFPYSFKNFFTMSKIDSEKVLLEKIKLYLPLKELPELISEWIMCSNLHKYATSSIEETYYIQSEKENRYIEEILVSGEISMSQHAGIYMFSNNDYLNKLKSEHLRKKDNHIHLKKITWDKYDSFNISIKSYEKEFFALVSEDGLYININESKIKHDKKDWKFINFELPVDEFIGFSLFKGKPYDVRAMKPFFLFKTQEDIIEYQCLYEQKVIYSIKFKINKIIITSPVKKIEMTYDELFSITEQNHYVNM